MDASQSIRKGSPVRRRGASASNCESGVRGAGNGKPPDGWSEGSAGVVNGMFGLLASDILPFSDQRSAPIADLLEPEVLARAMRPISHSMARFQYSSHLLGCLVGNV